MKGSAIEVGPGMGGGGLEGLWPNADGAIARAQPRIADLIMRIFRNKEE
jgi:hypothetical protein